MKKKQIVKYPPLATSTPLYRLYHITYSIDDQNNAIIATHSILQLGTSLPMEAQVILVHDGSAVSVKEFRARIIHADGKTKTFGKHDLSSYALSSGNVIQTGHLRYIPISKEIRPGDFLEVYTKQQYKLPELGIYFTLNELDNPADNIQCNIEIPADKELQWDALNTQNTPKISQDGTSKIYSFRWDHYQPRSTNVVYGQKNNAPGVLASFAFPVSDPTSGWKAYGDWYLSLLKNHLVSTDRIDSLTIQITEGATTDKARMDSIFAYSQENFRYEQVYIENGEWIPNTIDAILDHGYGDCKDYSLLIYLMAQSAGLNPELVLTFRGLGVKFYPDVAASQFNHMLVTATFDGERYWYDGTNRAGPPIPTRDLTNAPALILKDGASAIDTIDAQRDAKLLIDGELKQSGHSSFQGTLNITLTGQYAVRFLTVLKFLNQRETETYLKSWITANIHSNMDVWELEWVSGKDEFFISVTGVFPNAYLQHESKYYTSLRRILNNVLPTDPQMETPSTFFYYPYYYNVSISLVLPGFSVSGLANTENTNSAVLSMDYYIPPGPYSDKTRTQVLQQIDTYSIRYSSNYTLHKEPR